MGAGISQKDLNRRLYTRVKNLQRQLARAGIASQYKSLTLLGETSEGPFQIFYRTLRASNGECAALPVCILGSETFGGSCDNTFGRAFERLLESGKRPPVPVDMLPV
jgi:hypothetical protein